MRTLTAAMRTAIAAGAHRFGIICEIDYPTTPLRAWTGIGDLSWDSQTWKGVGDFGGISSIVERAGTAAGKTTLTLSGVPTSLLSLAQAETSQGRRVKVWLAGFDDSWGVIADPYRLQIARTNTHKIIDSAEQCIIQVACETWLARLRHPRTIRYTLAEWSRRFPGDRSMEFAGTIGEKPLLWGVPMPTSAAGSSHSGGNTIDYER